MDKVGDHHEYCCGGFDPEEIVITGMAGRFPECKTVGELLEGLMTKQELYKFSNVRFEKGACKLPYSSAGIIADLDKFDADYFSLPYPTADGMDPAIRKCLEVSYEAIADAGYDPVSLKGANIGVYNATINDDVRDLTGDTSNLEITGHSWIRCLKANRVSYCLDFIGPSCVYDTACSSSAVATWAAVKDMLEGRAEAALVNACQINLNPATTQIYTKIGVASSTGVNSNPFDAFTDGILRAESVTAIFLQKAKHARRAYATICSTKFVTSGYVPEGISVPSTNMQIKVYKEILQECGLQPNDIDYIEAHGTGTTVGDPIELNSVAAVYCENGRTKPMYVGTVKSNIGHTEAAAGICGIIKAIFAFETGKIPPNLKFCTPNPRCQALVDGKLKIVTEPLQLKSPYIPINSLGLGGTIVQAMLKQNPNTYSSRSTKKSKIPKMIFYPATCESAVTYVFDYIREHPDLPEEFFALLHKLSFCPNYLKPIRGYAFYQDRRDPVTEIKVCSGEKRPIWFIYTGMGCQWRGMGLQLMEIDVFADSMRRCAEVLKPLKINLFDILKPDSDILDKDRCITNAFVGIAAIQVSLTDVLSTLGILPDGIAGHSTGEILAAYSDGCISLEEAILSAYARGLAVEEANLKRGAMAAVGLSWKEATERCPKNVFPACHNADDSVTISGLTEDVEKFVATLKKENIFAKVVNAYGYCFHCKHVEPAAPLYRKKLLEIMPKPHQRSSRWISSSYLESEWNNENCKSAGAEYFVHNLMSPVLFNEAIKKIPANAVTIEIGPHFLLQSILKRAVGPDSINVGLMKRDEPDNLKFFFQSIGKLYLEGLDPKIEALYPSVQFPVPRMTPRISDLIQWNYSTSYEVPKWEPVSGELKRVFHLEKADAYLMDHFIDGRSLFPATGYIFLAWEMLASKLQKDYTEMPVLIENFKIHRATVMTQLSSLQFTVNILGESGNFEIMTGHSLVASGQIFEWKNGVFSESEPVYQSGESMVSGADIYNELKIAGYEYKQAFQGLIESNMDGTQGLVMWQDRWIPFLDALLLFFGLITNTGSFQLPTGALSFKIDPSVLLKRAEEQDNGPRGMPVRYHKATKTCRSVGVEITKLAIDPAPYRPKDNHPNLEEYKFVPYLHSYIPDKQIEIDLLRYMWACNKVLADLGKRLKKDVLSYKFCIENVNDINLEDYMKSLTEKHSLLRFLMEVLIRSHEIKNNQEELYSIFRKAVGNDLLNNIMLTEYPLRTIIEIISENSFRKLNVVEVNNSGFSLVLPSIISLVEKYSYMKLKSTVLVTGSQINVDAEELNRNNIQKKSFDTLETFSKENKHDVVVGSYIKGTLTELKVQIQSLATLVKPSGFVVFFCKEKFYPVELFLANLCGENIQLQSQTAIEKIFHESNLLIVSKIFDSFSSAVYLLRPVAPTAPCKVLKIKEDGLYKWIEDLKSFLVANNTDTLWLVADDTSISGIVGMVNCLKQEPGGERVKCIFISPKDGESKPPPFSFEQPFYKQLLAKNLIMNVWRDGSWGSFKHVLLKNRKELKNVDHCYVNCRKFGDLSSFEWIESCVKYASKTDDKFVHIYYSGLNFRDVMIATGKLSTGRENSKAEVGDSVFGMEFSGRDESGRRVAGLVSGCGMATSTLVHPSMLFDVPDNWTLEEAATVPVVYSTSYYALLQRGQLKKGEKILIHSGTGGIGIAAINIALSLRCEVFTTVGNDEKKKYLRKLFPQIKDDNISCSRNTSFESMIMKRTNGKGVDVVLNSLADDKFLASVRCVAKHGRFLEIGKYDASLDRNLGLKVFLENISFHGVCLDQFFERNPHNIEAFHQIFQMVRDGIKSGVVRPLDRTAFERNGVEHAFRYMAKGIHVGKVLLKIREEEPDKRATPKTLVLPAIPNTYFYTNKVYIIIGGLGGFGIEVTKWILSRGGKNVILTSRYGARTAYQHLCLKRWHAIGANVQVLTLNAAKRSEAEQLLKEASKIGPVGGIFNSAVVLKDAFIESQTPKAYDEVCTPKATATKYLDELSRKLCPSLDYFVCFSSISCGRGNAGQTNYGYANSVMERICEQRKSNGLHGLAIQWGIIGEVGVVHRHMGDDAMIAGVFAQSVKSCLEALDLFCQGNYPVVSSYMTTALATKKDDQSDVLFQIGKILGLKKEITEAAANRTFGEMGIDSLIGVEIRQLMQTSLDITLSTQELLEMKYSELRDLVTKSEDKTVPKIPSLVSTAEIKLPTLSHNESVLQLNKVRNGIPIFIVNIGDNDIATFDFFAQAMEMPVFTLQWTKSITATNVEELAKYFLNMIKTKTKGASFHLIGFSIGGALAFEMARVDDMSDKSVRSITLLDGSESLYKTLSNEPETRNPEVSVFLNFVEQFSSECTPKLENELLKAKTLDQRIKITLNFLTSTSIESVNKNEITDSITEYIRKANMIHSYSPTSNLLKNVILIEDPTKVLANDVTELKRVFQQVVIGKVVIHRLLSKKDLNKKDAVNKLKNMLSEDVFTK